MCPKASKVIRLFDRYTLTVPEKMHCHEDGLPGRRVLFLSDAQDAFTISFEEGMEPMDTLPALWENTPNAGFQTQKGGTNIFQRRKNSGAAYAFFHMEFPDPDGGVLLLPGQMVVNTGYRWAHGVEPVLLELMNSISVLTMETKI